jgi:hypothetical protein
MSVIFTKFVCDYSFRFISLLEVKRLIMNLFTINHNKTGKTMHKTIEEINLGLSNLNLVADAQSQNPFETFQAVYKYLNEVETIEFASKKYGITKYVGRYENVMIKIDKEEWRSILSKYCCDGWLATLNIFIELRDANEVDSGWSVYKFVDVTPKRQN